MTLWVFLKLNEAFKNEGRIPKSSYKIKAY